MNEHETPVDDELLDDGVFDGTDIEHGDVCSTCDDSLEVECPDCSDGFVCDANGDEVECSTCGGEGFIDCPDCD